ncbi:hypothetical protein NMG60_11004066 [Bertholletia excelsa]
MESPFLALILLIFGILLSFFANLVQSQENVNHGAQSPGRAPPPPPPPPPSSRSPPPLSLRTRDHVPSRPKPPPPPLPPRRSHRGPRRPARENSHGKASSTSKQNLNLGKKLGLTFFGIVVMMQVGVVAFLVIKRRQLLKNEA